MATVERLLVRGTRIGARSLQLLGDEFRERRLTLGFKQDQVARAAGISRSVYCLIENGGLKSFGVVRAAQIGALLGLDVSVRAYPGPAHLRDAAQNERLQRVVREVALPLVASTEWPLPQRPGERTELRAWDLLVDGLGQRTAMELEMRICDSQALERRARLKLRDDPVDSFVLLVADTRTNRETLRLHPDLLGLPRLVPSVLFRALRAGRHPSSGIVLI